MALAMLKNTSNPNYTGLCGRVGDLTLTTDGRFKFSFMDTDGEMKVLSSSVTGRLGDPNDFRSKNVNIITARSQYDFEKLENYIEEASLYSHVKDDSLDERVAAADGLRDLMNAFDQPFGKETDRDL